GAISLCSIVPIRGNRDKGSRTACLHQCCFAHQRILRSFICAATRYVGGAAGRQRGCFEVWAKSLSPDASAEIEQTPAPSGRNSSAKDIPHRAQPGRAPTEVKGARDDPLLHLLVRKIVRATPLLGRQQQVDGGSLGPAVRPG